MRQFELASGASRLVCWLDDDARLRKGVVVTLGETGDRVWVVRNRYRSVREQAELHASQRWSVGGLR